MHSVPPEMSGMIFFVCTLVGKAQLAVIAYPSHHPLPGRCLRLSLCLIYFVYLCRQDSLYPCLPTLILVLRSSATYVLAHLPNMIQNASLGRLPCSDRSPLFYTL